MMINYLNAVNTILLSIIALFAMLDSYNQTRKYRPWIIAFTLTCIALSFFKCNDDKATSARSERDSNTIRHLDTAVIICDTINQRLKRDSATNSIFQKAIFDSLHLIKDSTGRPVNIITHSDKSKNVNIDDNHGIIPITFK